MNEDTSGPISHLDSTEQECLYGLFSDMENWPRKKILAWMIDVLCKDDPSFLPTIKELRRRDEFTRSDIVKILKATYFPESTVTTSVTAVETQPENFTNSNGAEVEYVEETRSSSSYDKDSRKYPKRPRARSTSHERSSTSPPTSHDQTVPQSTNHKPSRPRSGTDSWGTHGSPVLSSSGSRSSSSSHKSRESSGERSASRPHFRRSHKNVNTSSRSSLEPPERSRSRSSTDSWGTRGSPFLSSSGSKSTISSHKSRESSGERSTSLPDLSRSRENINTSSRSSLEPPERSRSRSVKSTKNSAANGTLPVTRGIFDEACDKGRSHTNDKSSQLVPLNYSEDAPETEAETGSGANHAEQRGSSEFAQLAVKPHVEVAHLLEEFHSTQVEASSSAPPAEDRTLSSSSSVTQLVKASPPLPPQVAKPVVPFPTPQVAQPVEASPQYSPIPAVTTHPNRPGRIPIVRYSHPRYPGPPTPPRMFNRNVNVPPWIAGGNSFARPRQPVIPPTYNVQRCSSPYNYNGFPPAFNSFQNFQETPIHQHPNNFSNAPPPYRQYFGGPRW